MSFQLTSPSFKNGEPIPPKFTCDAADVSPTLAWTAPPEKTQSFVLINDDPDCNGPAWVHWLIYNIPSKVRELKEAMSTEASLPDGTLQGLNDFKRVGYGGPCPPSGVHHYSFKLYALDVVLKLAAKATKPQIESAMKGHILAETQLIGTYVRAGR